MGRAPTERRAASVAGGSGQAIRFTPARHGTAASWVVPRPEERPPSAVVGRSGLDQPPALWVRRSSRQGRPFTTPTERRRTASVAAALGQARSARGRASLVDGLRGGVGSRQGHGGVGRLPGRHGAGLLPRRVDVRRPGQRARGGHHRRGNRGRHPALGRRWDLRQAGPLPRRRRRVRGEHHQLIVERVRQDRRLRQGVLPALLPGHRPGDRRPGGLVRPCPPHPRRRRRPGGRAPNRNGNPIRELRPSRGGGGVWIGIQTAGRALHRGLLWASGWARCS